MKKLLIFLSCLSLLTSCEIDALNPIAEQFENLELESRGMILICHYSAQNDSWHLMNIPTNSWNVHESHGDVSVSDLDGDGFVPENHCEYGNMGDCDDTDSWINPGASEICGNGLDDDCDGFMDEEDAEDCNLTLACAEEELEVEIDPDGVPGNGDEFTAYVYPDNFHAYGDEGGINWGIYGIDVPDLPNYPTPEAGALDFNGKENTDIIVEFTDYYEIPGNFGHPNPAGVYAAKQCKQLAEETGCDWYLPAYGELLAISRKIHADDLANGTNNLSTYFPASAPTRYWTSTELNWALAHTFWPNFMVTGQNHWSPVNKNSAGHCKCIRRD